MAKNLALVCLQGHEGKIGHHFILQQLWIWHGGSGSFSLFVTWLVTFPALIRIFSSFAHMVLVIVVHGFEMTQCSKLCMIAWKYNTHRLMKTLIKVVVCWWALRGKSLNSTHITYPSQRVGEGHLSYRNVHPYTCTCVLTFVDREINVFN